MFVCVRLTNSCQVCVHRRVRRVPAQVLALHQTLDALFYERRLCFEAGLRGGAINGETNEARTSETNISTIAREQAQKVTVCTHTHTCTHRNIHTHTQTHAERPKQYAFTPANQRTGCNQEQERVETEEAYARQRLAQGYRRTLRLGGGAWHRCFRRRALINSS